MEAWRQEIIEYEYIRFGPVDERRGNNDSIRFTPDTHGLITVPQDSRIFIRIEVKLEKNPGAAADATKPKVKWVNNYPLQLFDRMQYKVNGTEIDSMQSVGVTSTVKNYLTYTKGEIVGLATAGFRDITPSWTEWDMTTVDETQCAVVPLSSLSGFAVHFKDVLVRCSQELILVRSGTDKNAYHITDATTADGYSIKFKIIEIYWEIPVVKFTLELEKQILLKMKKNDKMSFGYMNWESHDIPGIFPTKTFKWSVRTTNRHKPKFVVLVFQTDRRDNHLKDSSLFDHVNVRSVSVQIGERRFPQVDTIYDFSSMDYNHAYLNYADFMRDYWKGEKLCEPAMLMENFKDRAIFVIKCVQGEDLKTAPVDITLTVVVKENFPANTTAQVILITPVKYSYELLHGTVRQLD